MRLEFEAKLKFKEFEVNHEYWPHQVDEKARDFVNSDSFRENFQLVSITSTSNDGLGNQKVYRVVVWYR